MNKNMKKLLSAAAALLLLLSLFSCGGTGPSAQTEETEPARTRNQGTEPGPASLSEGGLPAGSVVWDASEKSKYYCPDVFFTTVVPCRINVETGEKQYACPVEDCDHFGTACYYYNKWVTAQIDTGNYLVMKAVDYPGGNVYILAYEWKSGKMYEIYRESPDGAGKLNNLNLFVSGASDGVIFGYRIYDDASSYVTLEAIDLFSGEVSHKKTIKSVFVPTFCESGRIFGVNLQGPAVMAFPESDPEPYALPDGCAGYEFRRPGCCYKTGSPAAIYDTASGKTVKPDRKLDITSPVYSNGYYYYQSRSGLSTALKADGTEAQYVSYDNDIYRQGLDGKAEKFSIPTEYHFIVYAASGDWVIGRLMYRLSDGVYTPFEELDYDHIRINLTTGKAQLLNLYVEHDYFLD